MNEISVSVFIILCMERLSCVQNDYSYFIIVRNGSVIYFQRAFQADDLQNSEFQWLQPHQQIVNVRN